MKHTSQTCRNTRSFQALPAELRSRIIHYLWFTTPIIRTHFRSTPIELQHSYAARNSNSKPLPGLPQWLRASRGLLYEGMAQFDLVFDSSIGPHHACVSDHQHTRLINPATRGIITIWDDIMSNPGNPKFAPGATFEFSEAGVDAITRVLSDTTEYRSDEFYDWERSRLHTLRVRAGFSNVCIYCQRYYLRHNYGRGHESQVWHLDLSPLEVLQIDLQLFEFEITGVDTRIDSKGYRHHSSCWDEAQGAFEKEVKRVGRLLTGDSCSIFTMETTSTSPKNVVFRVVKSKH
jgi:hypothetical protein